MSVAGLEIEDEIEDAIDKQITEIYEAGDIESQSDKHELDRRQRLNNELLHSWRAGNAEARDELIRSNYGLATYLADTVANKVCASTDVREEMKSEALLAVTRGVMAIYDKEIDNIEVYLGKAILNSLVRIQVVQGGMSIPPQSRRRAAAKGIELETIHSVSLPGDMVDQRSERPRHGSLPPMFELIEELEACCRTPRQLEIIRLFVEGNEQDEIAQLLDISEKTVYRERLEIFARYTERENRA